SRRDRDGNDPNRTHALTSSGRLWAPRPIARAGTAGLMDLMLPMGDRQVPKSGPGIPRPTAPPTVAPGLTAPPTWTPGSTTPPIGRRAARLRLAPAPVQNPLGIAVRLSPSRED